MNKLRKHPTIERLRYRFPRRLDALTLDTEIRTEILFTLSSNTQPRRSDDVENENEDKDSCVLVNEARERKR